MTDRILFHQVNVLKPKISLVKNDFNLQFNTTLTEPRISRSRRETALCIAQNLFGKIECLFQGRPRTQRKRFGKRLSKSTHAP